MSEALTVLSWHENLPRDEQPPRWIWWSNDLVDKWFEKVTENRKRPAKPSAYDNAEDMPMMGNELTKDQ